MSYNIENNPMITELPICDQYVTCDLLSTPISIFPSGPNNRKYRDIQNTFYIKLKHKDHKGYGCSGQSIWSSLPLSARICHQQELNSLLKQLIGVVSDFRVLGDEVQAGFQKWSHNAGDQVALEVLAVQKPLIICLHQFCKYGQGQGQVRANKKLKTCTNKMQKWRTN